MLSTFLGSFDAIQWDNKHDPKGQLIFCECAMPTATSTVYTRDLTHCVRYIDKEGEEAWCLISVWVCLRGRALSGLHEAMVR